MTLFALSIILLVALPAIARVASVHPNDATAHGRPSSLHDRGFAIGGCHRNYRSGECASASKAALLYDAYNAQEGKHFYTTDENEINRTVNTTLFRSESFTIRMYKTQEPSTVPLFRLVSHAQGFDHFYTTSLAERWDALLTLRYGYDRVEGYIYNRPTCCSVPLYRLKNLEKPDHVYTTSLRGVRDAISSGYTRDGIVGYVIPVNQPV